MSLCRDMDVPVVSCLSTVLTLTLVGQIWLWICMCSSDLCETRLLAPRAGEGCGSCVSGSGGKKKWFSTLETWTTRKVVKQQLPFSAWETAGTGSRWMRCHNLSEQFGWVPEWGTRLNFLPEKLNYISLHVYSWEPGTHERLLEMKVDGTCKLKPQRVSFCSEPFPTRKVLATAARLSTCYRPFVRGSVAGGAPGGCSLLGAHC